MHSAGAESRCQGENICNLELPFGRDKPSLVEDSKLWSDEIGDQARCSPKTIRDAVEICRRLSVRYLWVDALRIIQDDSQDFAREVPKMGLIYARPIFSIAATDSTNSESGCFRGSNPLSRKRCRVVSPNETILIFGSQSAEECNHNENIEESPLTKRGWVVQERMMSPRTIHFTKDEIIWECRERMFCESCSRITNNESTKLGRYCGKNILARTLRDGEGFETYQPSSDLWSILVTDCSKTEISNIDDKLTALAGIAQVISECLHLKALYGIWLECFINGLFWQEVNGHTGRYDELKDTIPTWSWAFIEGPVDIFDEYLQGPELFAAEITAYPPVTAFPSIRALREQIPQPGSFKVRNWVKKYNASSRDLVSTSEHSSVTTTPEIQNPRELHSLASESGSEDYTLERRTNHYISRPFICFDECTVSYPNLICVLLKRRYRDNVRSDTGLVLVQVDPRLSRYKRVGIFEESINQGFNPRFESLQSLTDGGEDSQGFPTSSENDAMSQLLSISIADTRPFEHIDGIRFSDGSYTRRPCDYATSHSVPRDPSGETRANV